MASLPKFRNVVKAVLLSKRILAGGQVSRPKDPTSAKRVFVMVRVSFPGAAKSRSWYTEAMPGKVASLLVIPMASSGDRVQFLHSLINTDPTCCTLLRKAAGFTATGIGAGLWSTRTVKVPPITVTLDKPMRLSQPLMFGAV